MITCIHRLIYERGEVMAKETQRAKIERLEKELWEYKILVSKLQREIYDMQDKADDSFENSTTYQQMSKKIKVLKLENQCLKGTIEHDKKTHELISENRSHNERGAGRKERFTEQEKEMIKMYRAQGKGFREIAEMYCCSVGLVHKIISS